jgi:hypothetical protein
MVSPTRDPDPIAIAGEIARLLEQAKPVPLTKDVRVDKVELLSLTDVLADQSVESEFRSAAEAIQAELRNARRVPFTDNVRIQKDTPKSLAARLRAVASSGHS